MLEYHQGKRKEEVSGTREDLDGSQEMEKQKA